MTTRTMVALPGALCSPLVFAPLARELEREVDLSAWEWLLPAPHPEPGSWDIPAVAERAAAYLASRGEGPVVLCGHSTGGAIALQLAIHHPDLVSGLVLLDTGAHMKGHGDVDSIIAGVEERWGPDLFGAVLDRSFATPPPLDVRDELVAWAGRVRPEAAIAVLRSQRDLDLTDDLGAIDVPTLVVHGRHDAARPPAQGAELAAAIPGAVLVLVDSGHTPQYERPEAVAAAVRDLLGRLDPQ